MVYGSLYMVDDEDDRRRFDTIQFHFIKLHILTVIFFSPFLANLHIFADDYLSLSSNFIIVGFKRQVVFFVLGKNII